MLIMLWSFCTFSDSRYKRRLFVLLILVELLTIFAENLYSYNVHLYFQYGLFGCLSDLPLHPWCNGSNPLSTAFRVDQSLLLLLIISTGLAGGSK